MMDHVARPALRGGHLERIEHERGLHAAIHRPADDAAAEDVEHDGEVQPRTSSGSWPTWASPAA